MNHWVRPHGGLCVSIVSIDLHLADVGRQLGDGPDDRPDRLILFGEPHRVCGETDERTVQRDRFGIEPAARGDPYRYRFRRKQIPPLSTEPLDV